MRGGRLQSAWGEPPSYAPLPSHHARSFPHPSSKASSELDASSEMSLIVRVVCATKLLPTLTFDDY